MAYQVSVEIYYEVPGDKVERSWGFTIEQDQPPTMAMIAELVRGAAEEFVASGTNTVLGFPLNPTPYTFEVTSVFELP